MKKFTVLLTWVKESWETEKKSTRLFVFFLGSGMGRSLNIKGCFLTTHSKLLSAVVPISTEVDILEKDLLSLGWNTDSVFVSSRQLLEHLSASHQQVYRWLLEMKAGLWCPTEALTCSIAADQVNNITPGLNQPHCLCAIYGWWWGDATELWISCTVW